MTPTKRSGLLVVGITAGLFAGCDATSPKKTVPVAPLTGAELEAFEKLQKAIHGQEQADREAGRIQ